ncbi:MAG TPA: hypothetical protein VKY36_03840 [Moheibacter sp.]|nr:hypothetical protein [Moheibacter sp.]
MKKILFVLLIITLINCKDRNLNSTENSSEIEEFTEKKDKFLVEAERDVESLDSTISIDFKKLQKIQVRIFPSFDQGHSISFDSRDRKISFFQITQNLNRTVNYYKIPEEEREYHLYEFMKNNSSKNFQKEISQEEEQNILKDWATFKKANYQFKNIEQFDGAEFFTSIYEKDTILYVNTNSPSSHQTKLLKNLLDLCAKYAEDSITKRNISSLKEYL